MTADASTKVGFLIGKQNLRPYFISDIIRTPSENKLFRNDSVPFYCYLPQPFFIITGICVGRGSGLLS